MDFDLSMIGGGAGVPFPAQVVDLLRSVIRMFAR